MKKAYLCTALCSVLAVLSQPLWAGEVLVSAAASLTDAFTELGRDYQKAHPEVTVQFNFGASGALLQQLAKGAPVDVLATADQATMDSAAQSHLIQVDTRRDFAGNALVLVVPAEHHQPLKSLDDLKQPGVRKLAIGNPDSVPVGRYTQTALEAAGLWEALQDKRINTLNVRQSLDYVARGEVDAGFVYRTDAATQPKLVKIAFEVPVSTPVRYPAAVTAQSKNAQEAQDFVRYLGSEPAQKVLNRYGFLAP